MALPIKSSEQALMSEINVTPLVDVMLVLLIIFIVTAPLLMHAVPVKLPKTTASSPIDPKTHAHLSVDQAGKIYLDEQPVEFKDLMTKLAALRQRSPDLTVHLMGDERASYGQISKVLGVINQVGITKLSLVMDGR